MTIQDRVSALLAEYGIPSAAIGVLRDGEMSEFAVGVKDVETAEPATPDTVYQCGSMTKTWTALAFLQLVDEGKAGLDEPIRTYLPGFAVADPETTAKVTARHLLNHTNGIEEAFGHPGDGDDIYERMVENIADAPQVFPLGHTHGYSAALGYAILARIMEVLDGKRWDDVLRDRLFTPLGLTGTNSRREQVDETRAATGHLIRSLAEGPIVTPMPYLPREFGPGGGITSTVRDVLTMAHVLLHAGLAPGGRRIVSAASVQEMLRSRVPVPDPYLFGPAWALGLIVCDWHGETVYATDGSTIGQNARLRILPDSNTAVAVLTNGGPRESFARKVFREILGNVPELPEPDPALKLDLPRYEGVYERPGARYEVSAEGGTLHLTLDVDPMQAEFLGKAAHLRYELLPVSPAHFLMPSADPLEDTQTVAIYDFADGAARYLHTNCRVHPRRGSSTSTPART
ncbi:beta-lactamase class C [Amycolatopsis mediterranei S699]|uniref:Beta-lactamase class C n=2 Tax=Amycolatopsis mediterranei TaxID=33910 RepID=A0A0H3D7R2_AMYMU|nr:serine hydrolase domain-containing protein [Amycolatopsis mediterranei]ADJ46691.1 beta-lactamase class C [Amycolatopsis mediterranei U32]AEK43492.1 beta-lactamase class C [Amycolatopsis mediterranei S699]AFO78403.1 beta-lactamase class C [Amycolatopsis mediterranei S699]AGT85531.1 beta-lactamase class C [Amycolatopsis mediterranei RB]KDO11407.1 beta-lactamase [Amycolatopsis mediterranei]